MLADLLRSHTSQHAHSKPPLAKLHTPHILNHTYITPTKHTHTYPGLLPCLCTPYISDTGEILADLLRVRTCLRIARTSQNAHSEPPSDALNTPHILNHTNQACTHTHALHLPALHHPALSYPTRISYNLQIDSVSYSGTV